MACYFIANIAIEDDEVYRKYLDEAADVFDRFNGTYLAVDDAPVVLEGSWDYTRVVVIRFDTPADFRAWYDSPDYRRIREFRLAASRCDTILVSD